MSLFTKILAGLNLIAAGAFLFFAGQCLYARSNWEKVLDSRREQLQGIQTEALLGKLAPGELDKLKDEAKSIESDAAKRHAAAGHLHGQLAVDDKQAHDLMFEVGPSDAQRVQRDRIGSLRSSLEDEKQSLVRQKLEVFAVQARYQNQLTKYEADIETLQRRLDRELGIEKKVLAENTERKKEFERIQVELEEAVAAREAAEQSLRETRAQLARLQANVANTAQRNQEIADDIKRIELPSER